MTPGILKESRRRKGFDKKLETGPTGSDDRLKRRLLTSEAKNFECFADSVDVEPAKRRRTPL